MPMFLCIAFNSLKKDAVGDLFSGMGLGWTKAYDWKKDCRPCLGSTPACRFSNMPNGRHSRLCESYWPQTVFRKHLKLRLRILLMVYSVQPYFEEARLDYKYAHDFF